MNMIKYVVFSLLLLGIPVIGQGQDVKISMMHIKQNNLLILNLKNVLTTSTTSIKNISQRELYLVEAYRLLNEKHRTNIDDMIKALNLEQQVNENNK